MKLRSIKIRNFLSIEEVKFDDLKNINVITGPNNSGKTNLLRAIEFICSVFTEPVPISINYYHNNDFSRPFRVEVSVTLTEEERKALEDSLICSFIASLQNINAEKMRSQISKFNLLSLLRNFVQPLFKDIAVYAEGSGSTSFPHNFGLVFRDGQTSLYLHNWGLFTSSDTITSSRVLKSPFELFEKLIRDEDIEDNNYLDQLSKESIFSYAKLLTNGVAYEFQRQQAGVFERIYPDFEPYIEIRQFFITRNRQFDYQTLIGIPDVARIILQDSLVSLHGIRGYPERIAVEDVDKESEFINASPGKSLVRQLFHLKNSTSGNKKYSEVQKLFKDLTSSEFDIFISSREISKEEEPLVLTRNEFESSDISLQASPLGLRTERKTSYLHDIEVRFSNGKTSLSPSLSAAGLTEFLFLATAIAGNSDKIILLDEPAQNLHPSKQKIVLQECLQSSQSNDNQFFIVTHSPYLIPSSDLDSIYRIYRNENGCTTAMNLGKSFNKDKGKTQIQMRNADIKSLLFSSGVVLVEGPSDKIVIEKVDEYLSQNGKGADLQANEWPVMEIGGKSSLRFYIDLCEQLKLPWVSILDRDALMRIENGKDDMQLSTVLSALFDLELLNEDEKNEVKQFEVVCDENRDKWFNEKNAKALNRIARNHNIFIFEKDLEGALQTSATKRESKPLKALNTIADRIKNNNIPEEFCEMEKFLKDRIKSKNS